MPPTIPFTAYAQWHTEAGIVESGGRIDSWTDQIGGWVASATGASRPFTGRQDNGHDVVDFQGGQSLATTTLGTAIGNPHTIHAVFAMDAWPASENVYDGNSGRRCFLDRNSANGKFSAYNTARLDSSQDAVAGSYIVSVIHSNGAASAIWIDGVSTATGSTGTAAFDRLVFGANNVGTEQIDGWFKELIVQDGVATPTEIGDFYTGRNTYWNNPPVSGGELLPGQHGVKEEAYTLPAANAVAHGTVILVSWVYQTNAPTVGATGGSTFVGDASGTSLTLFRPGQSVRFEATNATGGNAWIVTGAWQNPYGAAALSSSQVGPDLGGSWEPLPLDSIDIEGTGINWNPDGSFSVDYGGTYQLGILFNFSHGESNQGRETNARLYNVTDATPGEDYPIAIARNQPGTDRSITFFFELDPADQYRVELGGGDSITSVVWNTAAIDLMRVGN